MAVTIIRLFFPLFQVASPLPFLLPLVPLKTQVCLRKAALSLLLKPQNLFFSHLCFTHKPPTQISPLLQVLDAKFFALDPLFFSLPTPSPLCRFKGLVRNSCSGQFRTFAILKAGSLISFQWEAHALPRFSTNPTISPLTPFSPLPLLEL